MTRRLILIIACISLLSGCGFALRGNITLPPSLLQMAIVGDDPEMIDRLEDSLRTNGVTITDTDSDEASVLNLNRSEYEREVRTTDANGLATSYTLIYKVEYDVTSSQKDKLQSNQKISQTRVFDYDPLQQLQADEEEEFLREEMQKEIVLQLLRRLSRI